MTSFPASPPEYSGQRIQELDLVRGAAILFVIAHHAAWRFRPLPTDVFGIAAKNVGWIGVDIFFVVSGLMIGRMVLRPGFTTKTFLRNRFFRIIPLYSVALITFIGSAAITDRFDELNRIWSPILLLNGWTIPIYGYDGVPYTITWSLSVEETAYVALGFLCGSKIRSAPMVAATSFILVAWLTRGAVVSMDLFELDRLYFFVPARLDSIGFGVAVACYSEYRRHTVADRTLALTARVCGYVCCLWLVWRYQSVPISDPQMASFGYPMFAIAVALLLLSVTDSSARLVSPWGMRVWSPLARIGKLSYFTYLFHIFSLELIRLINPQLSFWTATALAVATTHVGAEFSWLLFEQRMIRYGRKAVPATENPTPSPHSLTSP